MEKERERLGKTTKVGGFCNQRRVVRPKNKLRAMGELYALFVGRRWGRFSQKMSPYMQN